MKKNLKGKTIILTGANAGIGLYTAIELAKADATLVIACRNIKKAQAALKVIKVESGRESGIELMNLDIGSFQSIKKFVKDFKSQYSQLDILINNAGIHTMGYEKTEDGFQSVFGVNFLGGAILTHMLLDIIKKTPNSRIINVSSRRHAELKIPFTLNTVNDPPQKDGLFRGLDMYRKSKLAQICWSIQFQRNCLNANESKIINLHPGVCRTQILESA